ncbi:hypothetical protein B0H13DRAFT_1013708 [Mycena leptocephala]|nr:hypothetical protein B0H13DRAFT_1013708 [Mycena leptocephala]
MSQKCGAPPVSLFEPSTFSSPDFTRLIASNDPPPDSEISSIRDVVFEGQNHVDTLDAQIHILQASLAQLVRRRDEIAEHVRQHRAVISPVRRMPPELICEIFAMLSSSDLEEDMVINPPWYLGHICRSWRDTALSFTPLWSSITVPSQLSSEDTCTLSAIEAQLLRTANAPLDILWSDVQSAVDSRLLDLVIPHCSRWRSLCFQVDPMYDVRLLNWLHPVNGHLHRLEKLEALSTRHLAFPDVFSSAPNLRQVILTEESFYYSPTSIVIPWGQVTHYRGTYTPESQLEILRAIPNLVECAIGFREFYHHNLNPNVNPMVVLSHLRRLCIEQDGFLLYASAPLLEELTSVWFKSSTVIVPFVQRSLCTLKKLALMRCTNSSEVITVLQSLPSLTYLLLADQDNEDDEHADEQGQVALFSAMFISGTPSDICPNLASFVFGYRDEDEGSLGVLVHHGPVPFAT